MSLINVSKLTFAYESSYDNIFENVSFHIDTNWKLGFIGRNGRGKTTFLKLLLGDYKYTGTISCSGVEFQYFPFSIEDKTKTTLEVLTNKLINNNSDVETWAIIKELHYLKLKEDILYRPFNTLSGGEETRVLLAMQFLNDNNFLLIDEPTNHLDAEARIIVANYLKNKNGFILILHDRMFLDNCVDHIISINKTNIEIEKGNFSSWWANKAGRDKFEIDKNTKLKKDINRLTESAKRTSKWSDTVEKTKIGGGNAKGYIGHKSAKMMKRAKSIEHRKDNAIEEKSGLLKNIEGSFSLKISPLKHHSNRLIYFQKVNIFYDNLIICENISFDICHKERACLRGKNGSGKSSILKLILGDNIDYTGEINIASKLKISYVSQDTSYLKGSLENLCKESLIDETLFKAILRKLDFERIQFEKDIEAFSEGQKKKVLIAKSLSEEAHIYIWDEPLNFVDVISRMQIEELLLFYKPTILFVEHDEMFGQKVSNKIVSI